MNTLSHRPCSATLGYGQGSPSRAGKQCKHHARPKLCEKGYCGLHHKMKCLGKGARETREKKRFDPSSVLAERTNTSLVL